MFGVNIIDWLMIGIYLVGIMLVGVWAVKKVKSSTSFFMGDRKFGKIMMIFFMFGTGTHSDQAVGVAAKTYRSGASGIWYQWLWMFSTPFFWLIAPIFRRMRAVTTGDYFEIRYNASVSGLFALIGMLNMMFSIGTMLKGSSAMISAVSGGSINPKVAIIAMTVMFVIYGVAGGLSAAIVTDFIQGLLTLVLSFLILPIALIKVGGMEGVREKIADPAMLSIVAPGEITAFFITIISLNALIGWVTQPHNMSTCGAGRTELEGRIGTTVGMFLKRFCTIAWMLTGLIAVVLYAGKELSDVDQVYGLMAHDLLPTVLPGLIGLFIASMLASVMSSCDAFMVASSALFTENIYRRFFVKHAPDRHYTIVGRLMSMIIVISGITIAFNLESVVHGIEMLWMIPAMMGIAFWVGLFWRRATVAGAWAGTMVSFVVLLFTSKINISNWVIWDFNTQLASKLPDFMLWEGKIYLPWQMIIYLVAGFVALVVVSLFTRRVDNKKLDRLYACLRTPIGDDEPETDQPFTLPQGMQPGERKVLIKHPDFEIPKPSAVGIIGFLASWAAVGLLIWMVYLIIGV